MANQVQIPSSACIIGIAQSGKTTFSIENMEQNPNWSIFLDRNRAYLRLRPPAVNYVTGPWSKVRREFIYLLAKHKKVIYNPATDDDIDAMLDTLFAIKNKAMRNFEPIYIYFDEVDLYVGRQNNVEMCWTKYQGAGIVPIGIVQRISQMRDLSILFNSNAGIVVFNVTDGDGYGLIQNYGIGLKIHPYHGDPKAPGPCPETECDLCYIQHNSRIAGSKYIGAVWIPTAGQVVRL